MRGKRSPLSRLVSAIRNIPAYAGKTYTDGITDLTGREHPRVCGENFAENVKGKLGAGTSPRMRGKQAGRQRVINIFRNIPAYAGKTHEDRVEHRIT